jgi:hypothetical protein
VKKLAFGWIVIGCLFTVGCGDRNPSGSKDRSDFVGEVTGDDDSEVSPELATLTYQAFQRDADEEPLEGF